jgi:hypothetical protein
LSHTTNPVTSATYCPAGNSNQTPALQSHLFCDLRPGGPVVVVVVVVVGVVFVVVVFVVVVLESR